MISFLSKLIPTVERSKKRVGRGLGSGRGAKSGRGTTRHQRARQSIPLHFEGGQGRLVKKFPLLRGKGRNKPLSIQLIPISIEKLNIFSDGETINAKTLLEKHLIKSLIHESRIKILGSGKLEKKLTVELPVSQQAKAAIEKAGGTVKPL